MLWPRYFPVLCLALLSLLAPVGLPAGQEKPPKDKQAEDKRPPEKFATIRVRLPANAKLTIDDNATSSSGTDRLFQTPELPVGKTYQYTLKATWPSLMGRDIVRMAVAQVKAGKETVIDMNENSKDATSSQIVYVPTPQPVVDKMLTLAKVTKNDIVYDLGCGDGRVVVTAAKKYGARGVGVDIDPERIEDALANVKKAKVGDLVEIRQGDALKVPDLSKATVVMLYMVPEFMAKVKPILLKELKPGTRIVAHNFPIPGWEPLEKVTVSQKNNLFPTTLFLWQVAPKKE